jgi:fructose-1,6-bisphosphatase class II
MWQQNIDYIKQVALRTTSAAAKASIAAIGKGDKTLADKLATDAARKELNSLHINGTIVIGEGEIDEAPMLFIGEKVGLGGVSVDIAIDPLEGTNLCANNKPNAITVMTIARSGTILHAPDVYMQKIATRLPIPHDLLHIDDDIALNIKKLSQFINISAKDLVICMLNRPRHFKLMEEINSTGSQIKLIDDGDILGSIDPNIHLYVGIGGAPEGVIAASALKNYGGFMQGRLLLSTEDERNRALKCGITNFDTIYGVNDMIKSDAVFCATAVTQGIVGRQATSSVADSLLIHNGKENRIAF